MGGNSGSELQKALATYGNRLDIAYEDSAYSLGGKYLTIIDAFG